MHTDNLIISNQPTHLNNTMDQYIPIPEAMDPPKTATEFPTAANSISSVPQLLGETSDHEDDADFPSEPPGAPALPVDESGNIVYKYRDFSHVEETDVELDGEVPAPTPSNHRNAESSIRVQKFPVKLYAILAQKEFHDIICWMPHGRAWKVLKPNMFESLVMPLFFEYSNYHSFNRLVNAWSFRRISSGPDRGSYYHEVRSHSFSYDDGYIHVLPISYQAFILHFFMYSYFYGASLICRITCVAYQRPIRSFQ